MIPYNSKIFYDEFSYERNKDLRDFLKNPSLSQLLESVQQRCILVLGGDGTMLRAIGEYAQENTPFMWINFGHKGFLLNHPEWVLPNIPRFSSRNYPLLEVTNHETLIGTVFNDINIYSPEGKAISLSVSNGFWELDLWGDGMLLATPAGSTGHSKSYGWAILPHQSKNLVITPKGNISPQTSKVIDDAHQVTIRNTGRKYGNGP